jgi:hypothetical protein
VKVNLHIERLVLDGIDVEPAQHPRLQEALQTELGRLLAEGGIAEKLASGGAVPPVSAKEFRMSGDGNPTQLGRQIARSVYGGMGK